MNDEPNWCNKLNAVETAVNAIRRRNQSTRRYLIDTEPLSTFFKTRCTRFSGVPGLRSLHRDASPNALGQAAHGRHAPAAARLRDQSGIRLGSARRLLPSGRSRNVHPHGAAGHGPRQELGRRRRIWWQYFLDNTHT